jgi:hypothetical protein
MNAILQITLLALVPVCMLFAGASVLFIRAKTVISFLQLLGAGGLVIVVLTHLSEALHLFPWMKWGRPHSIGHYLDFWSAVLGVSVFPLGYLLHSLQQRRS